MKIVGWVQEGAVAIKNHPFFLNKVDFEMLRTRNYSQTDDIWLPQSSKKSITQNFSKKYRYSPPEEYGGDEKWCQHW